jgi:hypothetical protein
MVLTRDDLDEEYKDCSDEQLKHLSRHIEDYLMNYWEDALTEAVADTFYN